MQLGVTYDIKHSGQFLYKLSNEKDKKSYEITKFAIPTIINNNLLAEQSSTPDENKDSTIITKPENLYRLNMREL